MSRPHNKAHFATGWLPVKERTAKQKQELRRNRIEYIENWRIRMNGLLQIRASYLGEGK